MKNEMKAMREALAKKLQPLAPAVEALDQRSAQVNVAALAGSLYVGLQVLEAMEDLFDSIEEEVERINALVQAEQKAAAK